MSEIFFYSFVFLSFPNLSFTFYFSHLHVLFPSIPDFKFKDQPVNFSLNTNRKPSKKEKDIRAAYQTSNGPV